MQKQARHRWVNFAHVGIRLRLPHSSCQYTNGYVAFAPLFATYASIQCNTPEQRKPLSNPTTAVPWRYWKPPIPIRIRSLDLVYCKEKVMTSIRPP
ncbi:hypothetical protein LOAG_03003 [Loa loa]|uniref:Uncharacterized protein n=1 Tax=Loa loa TaxID=7209 RepID=A0A1S0U5N1_LOALO|nr:hypothetical protein LOAG_03003 [Loa loa]EFO25490.2 hypothetical protein LOAG_03003 [Loa loa]